MEGALHCRIRLKSALHNRVRLKSALHLLGTGLALILWVLVWGMSIEIILSFLSIGLLWVHAIIIELLLIHKRGLPMLLKLVLRMIVMLLILIKRLLLTLCWVR